MLKQLLILRTFPKMLETLVEEYVVVQLQRCSKRPLIVGIQGPQGSGKSTLVMNLVNALSTRYRVQSLSIDDLYLMNRDLEVLAPQNPLLRGRGLPGTHDIILGGKILEALASGHDCQIPRYDKSLLGGLGDRVPESQWTSVEGLADIVFIEGWMLGYQALTDEELVRRYQSSSKTYMKRYELSHLLEVNEFLKKYALWDQHLDAFVKIDTADISSVFGWRLEQEQRAKQGMSEEQVQNFVSRFMPMYELYFRDPLPFKNALVVEISPSRTVLQFKNNNEQ